MHPGSTWLESCGENNNTRARRRLTQRGGAPYRVGSATPGHWPYETSCGAACAAPKSVAEWCGDCPHTSGTNWSSFAESTSNSQHALHDALGPPNGNMDLTRAGALFQSPKRDNFRPK
jgi:hypothetical protein